MVGSILRVIFDHKDRGLRPEFRMAHRFNDLAEGKIVIGDISVGVGLPRATPWV